MGRPIVRPRARAPRVAAAAIVLLAACTATTGIPDGSPVGPGVAPVVTVPPAAAVVTEGEPASFTVTAQGTAPLSYQWQRDGTAIAGATAASYTTPATVAGDSGATFRVVVSNAAGSVTSSAATLTVGTPPPLDGSMTTASRTSGVAPLAVFFDAVDDVERGPGVNGSTFAWSSGVFQPADYEGAQYSWDFGDPGSGTWATGTPNRSRNTATGYTAAHVYESPGSYTATLTVTDASGTVRTYTQAITVSAFSGTTFYVAVAGSDSNDGRSSSTPFRSVDRAMTTALATDGPVRVLFNRGDTFAVTTDYAITKEGPGIIGAYGTGDRPVLSCADLGEVNIFSPRGAGRDWRIMDLDMVGPNTSTATGPVGPPGTSQGVQTLVLRVRARNWNVGMGWGDWEPIFATPHDEMALVECEVTSVGTYNVYLGGRRLMLLGNDFRDSGNTHVLRVWQAHKAVISNNNLLRPHAQRHCLKLHGPSVSGPDSDRGLRTACPATRWVTISDNNVEASTQSQWSISIGPQDSINDERISHVVYERNRHAGSPSLGADIEGSASSMMVRNNVFDGTLADGYTGILYMQRGIEPAPDDVRIYGNTFHKGGANSETVGFDIGAAVTRCRIRNNLFSYGSGSATLVRGGTGAGFAADHNLLTTAPGFAAGGFSLTDGSPAVDAGASLTELREDHVRAARPAGAGHDIGAYESH